MATKEAQRQWRERGKLGLLGKVCCCGKKLRLESGEMCNVCWLKTPEGKAYNQEKTWRCIESKTDLVLEAKAIASKFSTELGFVNSSALTESLRHKELEVLPSIGFAYFHHRKDGQTTLYGMSVAKAQQGLGWGRLLFYRVLCSAIDYRAKAKNSEQDWRDLDLSIVAKCPVDLSSNGFYERMGFELEEVEPGRKRKLNKWRYRFKLPLLFYCGGGGASKYDSIASKEGWRLGLRSTGRNKAHQHMQMIDCIWDETYDHEQHLRLIQEQKPLVAAVRDITSIEQLPEALKHVREIAKYCGRVLLVPKVKSWLPDYCWLAYSIPTSHGGTQIEPEWFGDRLVHLLGGDANDQAKYAQRLNVVSLDHNAAMNIAKFGKAMHQGVSDHGESVGKGCYESMKVSLQKQKAYWHDPRCRDSEQLTLLHSCERFT